MEALLLEVLEKAVDLGGRGLSLKALAGGAKPAKDAVTHLCDAGMLTKDGTKFLLTDTGWTAWEKAVGPQRVQAVYDKQVLDFLNDVTKVGNKALNATTIKKHSSRTRQSAVERGLLRQGETPSRVSNHAFRRGIPLPTPST